MALRSLRGVEHVADVEREDLVLPQASAQGDAEDHMVAPAGGVLAGDAKQERDLALSEGAGRTGDRVRVGAHADMDASSGPASNGKRQ